MMKMNFKLLCLGFFALWQFGAVFAQEDRPFQEEACSRVGGICYQKKYCGEVTQEGLCPQQQQKGVECCHEITGPIQSTPSDLNENCGTKGAACMERCPIVDETGLCKGNLKCCVLL